MIYGRKPIIGSVGDFCGARFTTECDDNPNEIETGRGPTTRVVIDVSHCWVVAVRRITRRTRAIGETTKILNPDRLSENEREMLLKSALDDKNRYSMITAVCRLCNSGLYQCLHASRAGPIHNLWSLYIIYRPLAVTRQK